MIANQRIPFSEVLDGLEYPAKTKIWEGQSTNDIRTSTHIYKQMSPILDMTPLYNVSLTSLTRQLQLILLIKQVMYLSTNGERACAQTKHFKRMYQSF